jgi:hypothetical protein
MIEMIHELLHGKAGEPLAGSGRWSRIRENAGDLFFTNSKWYKPNTNMGWFNIHAREIGDEPRWTWLDYKYVTWRWTDEPTVWTD